MRYLLLILASVLVLPLFAQKEKPAKDAQAQQQAMQQAMAAMMGNKDCKIDDNYQFDHQFTSELRTFNNKGKLENTFKIRNLLKNQSNISGTEILESNIQEMPQSTVIMNLETKKMITLVDQGGMKMAMCMDMDNPLIKSYMGEAEKEGTESRDKLGKMTKTGKTKTILGYQCEEWIAKDEEMSYKFWISDKSDIPMQEFYKNLGEQGAASPMAIGAKFPGKGMLMSLEGQSLKNQERIEMEVVEIKPKTKKTLSTVGYNKF
jgi:hypothetical protein